MITMNRCLAFPKLLPPRISSLLFHLYLLLRFLLISKVRVFSLSLFFAPIKSLLFTLSNLISFVDSVVRFTDLFVDMFWKLTSLSACSPAKLVSKNAEKKIKEAGGAVVLTA